MQVILGSNSPRRRELLGLLGAPFKVIVSDVEEFTEKTKPEDVVCDLSLQKAVNVFDKCTAEGDCVVIGSDTIVALDELILGKPKDAEDAFCMLKKLQGNKHQVYTGVALIIRKGDEVHKKVFYEKTDVYMHEMSDDDISRYIATNEPYDKAGSYGIQGIGSLFVKQIKGDYFNVVGLPVSMLNKVLKENKEQAGERSLHFPSPSLPSTFL